MNRLTDAQRALLFRRAEIVSARPAEDPADDIDVAVELEYIDKELAALYKENHHEQTEKS